VMKRLLGGHALSYEWETFSILPCIIHKHTEILVTDH
jgi:hypothetical protein